MSEIEPHETVFVVDFFKSIIDHFIQFLIQHLKVNNMSAIYFSRS